MSSHLLSLPSPSFFRISSFPFTHRSSNFLDLRSSFCFCIFLSFFLSSPRSLSDFRPLDSKVAGHPVHVACSSSLKPPCWQRFVTAYLYFHRTHKHEATKNSFKHSLGHPASRARIASFARQIQERLLALAAADCDRVCVRHKLLRSQNRGAVFENLKKVDCIGDLSNSGQKEEQNMIGAIQLAPVESVVRHSLPFS